MLTSLLLGSLVWAAMAAIQIAENKPSPNRSDFPPFDPGEGWTWNEYTCQYQRGIGCTMEVYDYHDGEWHYR